MGQSIIPGLLIGDRFKLVQILGSGFAGGVWLADDLRTGNSVVVKFFSKRNSVHDEYFSYLVDLHAVLSTHSLQNVISPIEIGEYGDLAYQILPHLVGYSSLNALDLDRFRDLRSAMSLLSKIAHGVNELHSLGIIHADLKPSNVLATNSSAPEVRIIDFGMVREIGAEDTVELVATWRYLHPIYTGEDGEKAMNDKSTTRVRIDGRRVAGTYVDIYALGIMALEMLTGEARYSRPPGERSLQRTICDRNQLFAEQPAAVRDGVSNLIFQMISVHPNRNVISARTIASIAESLAHAAKERSNTTVATRLSTTEAQSQTVTAVIALKGIRFSLEQQTLAMYAQGDVPASIASPSPDPGIVDQVTAVFSSARERTRSAWRIAMFMTITSFSLIVIMIVVAVEYRFSRATMDGG